MYAESNMDDVSVLLPLSCGLLAAGEDLPSAPNVVGA